MKKLFYFAIALTLTVSCAGNNQKSTEDSTGLTADTATVADSNAIDTAASLAKTEANEKVDEGKEKDADVKKESKENVKSEYGEWIAEYESTVKKYGKLRTSSDDYTQIDKLMTKYRDLEKKINKVKDKLSKEELAKFKKAKANSLKWEDWN